jgi:hypothetical protein
MDADPNESHISTLFHLSFFLLYSLIPADEFVVNSFVLFLVIPSLSLFLFRLLSSQCDNNNRSLLPHGFQQPLISLLLMF